MPVTYINPNILANLLLVDGNPEPGGPGTVYFDGYKGGSRHRVLSVDNQGRRARVGNTWLK